jgi:hypothetical protein
MLVFREPLSFIAPQQTEELGDENFHVWVGE